MSGPQRIQLRRTKGWRMPPNTVKVDRTTKWGNPFKTDNDFGRAAAVAAFRVWLVAPARQDTIEMNKRLRIVREVGTLRGKNLACWCPLGAPCHADVLLHLANQEPSQ